MSWSMGRMTSHILWNINVPNHQSCSCLCLWAMRFPDKTTFDTARLCLLQLALCVTYMFSTPKHCNPSSAKSHSITASQHAQLTLSASPFNIMARWMTGIYRQQRQTRHFILQKPSSCEKSQEPCNSHAGRHHTNNKLVFWLAFAGLVFEHVIWTCYLQ